VHMKVEIDRAAEALDHGDAAAPGVAHAAVPRPPAQAPLDGAAEMVRQIKIARDTAVKARSAAIIALKTLIVNAMAYHKG